MQAYSLKRSLIFTIMCSVVLGSAFYANAAHAASVSPLTYTQDSDNITITLDALQAFSIFDSAGNFVGGVGVDPLFAPFVLVCEVHGSCSSLATEPGTGIDPGNGLFAVSQIPGNFHVVTSDNLVEWGTYCTTTYTDCLANATVNDYMISFTGVVPQSPLDMSFGTGTDIIAASVGGVRATFQPLTPLFVFVGVPSAFLIAWRLRHLLKLLI